MRPRISSPRILIVEDDPVAALFLARNLQALGSTVVGSARSGKDALRLADQESPDLIFCDVVLEGDMDGIQLTAELRRRMDVPVVYITGNSDTETIDRAKRTCPSGYLVKPLEAGDLKSALELALHRHKTEALQRLHERAVAASQSAIFIADASHLNAPIIQVNLAFQGMTGFSQVEAMGQSCWFLEGPETDSTDSHYFREALRARRGCRLTLRHYRKDGSAFWGDVTLTAVPDAVGRITHFIIVENDVTSVRRLETQLRQAQKLEAIGQLAAGIAHEINTPAQYVGDNINFLGEAFSELAPLLDAQGRLLAAAKTGAINPELLGEVEATLQSVELDYLMAEIPNAIGQASHGLESINRIVRAMKEFSHPGTDEKMMVNLNAAIESTLTVCQNEWKYVAEVITDFDPSLPPICVLPGAVNQTLLNLVVNASHAIADIVRNGKGGKGRITVRTRRDGDWVEVRVSDTGGGIPERVRHRIFDPFFTTKPVGRGTGQGLAIAWAVVVEKHAGSLHFETEMGKGTTFVVRLPVKPLSPLTQQQAA